MINDVIKDVQHRMHGALEALHREFKTLRTGRANVAMLDGIHIDYYGTPTPLAQVASLKVPEPSMILAEPWDKAMVSVIEKAIRNSDLGLNPMTDGKVVRIPIPQLTEERRKELVKRALLGGRDPALAQDVAANGPVQAALEEIVPSAGELGVAE